MNSRCQVMAAMPANVADGGRAQAFPPGKNQTFISADFLALRLKAILVDLDKAATHREFGQVIAQHYERAARAELADVIAEISE